MKLKSIVLAGALCLAAPLLALGCSTDKADQSDVGQLQMPLTATSANGANYRISSAVFDISGPMAGQLLSDDYVGQPVAVVDLSEGDYQLSLQSGWVLEREDAGMFAPVVAQLKGANARDFSIAEGQTSQVQYIFATAGDEVVFGEGQLELSVAVEEVPAQWACGLAYYAAADGCDCGCGIPDPDCDDPAQEVFGCNTGEICTSEGLCLNPATCGNLVVEAGETCDDGNTIPGDGCDANCAVEGPPGWTCDGSYYAAADGCDCACGIPDPDCDDPAQQVLGCAPGDICTPEGLCQNNTVCGNGIVEAGEACDDGNTISGDGCDTSCVIEVPAGWACDATYYAAADGCDCACGIPDPDCNDPTQQVYNCMEGETCSPQGLCVQP